MEPLVKMAVSEIPPGNLIDADDQVFDYGHVLKPEHRAAGYKLWVKPQTMDDGTKAISARLIRNGAIVGNVGAFVNGNAIEPHSRLDERHRGQGLGKAMYEALYAHAMHNGIKRVEGGGHSEAAARIHRSLAAKHGFEYRPNQFGKAPSLDLQHGQYEYTLKSEFEGAMQAAGIELKPLSKSDDYLDVDSPVVAAMLGHNHKLNQTVEAARFLVNGHPPDPHTLRRHLWLSDGDPEKAALLHYGIEPNEKNLRALRGIKLHPFRKDEVLAHSSRQVEAALPEGADTAESVSDAFSSGTVKEVKLGGKHSQGTLLAHDGKRGKTYLLKPGSEPQNPARGENEQPATQSEREAAFYHVVESWGLGTFYPHCDLILIDGQQYAAMVMLPTSYQTINDIKAKHPGMPRHLFHPFLKNGLLHKWAIADWVLGQVDRNDGNIMARLERSHDGLEQIPSMAETEDVRLIDEGSAWAGEDFDPAHDGYSFTPGYLRAWFDGNFNALAPEKKMQVLPRVDAETEKMLRQWLDGLDPAMLSAIARKYNVDPTAAAMRLANLKSAVREKQVDLVVNECWALGPV